MSFCICVRQGDCPYFVYWFGLSPSSSVVELILPCRAHSISFLPSILWRSLRYAGINSFPSRLGQTQQWTHPICGFDLWEEFLLPLQWHGCVFYYWLFGSVCELFTVNISSCLIVFNWDFNLLAEVFFCVADFPSYCSVLWLLPLCCQLSYQVLDRIHELHSILSQFMDHFLSENIWGCVTWHLA